MTNNGISERDWFFGLLMRKTCTRREAVEHLKKREFNEEKSEELLAEAEEIGLLDDAAYARLFSEGHESWGKERIAFELERRGVSDDDIQSTLDEIDEEERMRPLIDSWNRSGIEERKIIARLYRRGFSSRAVRNAGKYLEN
jgi:regulatory protein